jgi:hypothetical protein
MVRDALSTQEVYHRPLLGLARLKRGLGAFRPRQTPTVPGPPKIIEWGGAPRLHTNPLKQSGVFTADPPYVILFQHPPGGIFFGYLLADTFFFAPTPFFIFTSPASFTYSFVSLIPSLTEAPNGVQTPHLCL